MADTLQDLFSELARVIARSPGEAEGDPGPWEPIDVEARDAATLLVDWANELLGRSEVESRSYGELRNLRLSELPEGAIGISAEIRGRHVKVWTSPLKAATYHALSLERRAGQWHAVVLFDV